MNTNHLVVFVCKVCQLQCISLVELNGEIHKRFDFLLMLHKKTNHSKYWKYDVNLQVTSYLYQTLNNRTFWKKNYFSHVYQHITCFDVMDGGVSVFPECFLFRLFVCLFHHYHFFCKINAQNRRQGRIASADKAKRAQRVYTLV